jgi:hypothetical protein
VCAPSQVQHVGRRLVHRHVLGFALHGRLADPQQWLLAHAVRELAIDKDHGGLGLGVDQVAVRLEHHGPPGCVQFLDVLAGRVPASVVVGGRAVRAGRDSRLHHKLTRRELRARTGRDVLGGHDRDSKASQLRQVVLVEVPLDRLGRVEQAGSQLARPVQERGRGTEVVLGRPDHHGVEVIPASVGVPDHRGSADAVRVQGLYQQHAFWVQSGPVGAGSDGHFGDSPGGGSIQLNSRHGTARANDQHRATKR